ncbi:MAG: MaoC family dehydratase N-terminal domain-containing protein [Firmicutes bacterium]|nr:MaoC family dehydratase N-terminal domain-containing protein [Bacillota bacterium]
MTDYTPWIGQVSPPRPLQLHAEAMQAFSRAIGSHYAPYFDRTAAQKAGYPDIIAPPTYAFTLPSFPISGLTLPQAGLIHAEQTLHYATVLYAGESLEIILTFSDYKSRIVHGQAMAWFTLVSTGYQSNGACAFTSQSLLVYREAAPHASSLA